MPHDHLSLQFELDHRNGFVHFRVHVQIFCIVIRIEMYGKAPAIRFLINFHGKGGKGQQIDAVPVLQSTQISIAGRDPDHIGNTGRMSAGGPHPQNIMIPPLYIHGMVFT